MSPSPGSKKPKRGAKPKWRVKDPLKPVHEDDDEDDDERDEVAYYATKNEELAPEKSESSEFDRRDGAVACHCGRYVDVAAPSISQGVASTGPKPSSAAAQPEIDLGMGPPGAYVRPTSWSDRGEGRN